MEKELKEKMDYLKELSKKKLNQFTQRLERYDRWHRSKYTIEKATNWAKRGRFLLLSSENTIREFLDKW